jgi:hypothetical protein
MNRTKIHLVASFGDRELSSIQRDELPSGITSKPANEDHFKTGQRN